jgi:hypothetical protein
MLDLFRPPPAAAIGVAPAPEELDGDTVLEKELEKELDALFDTEAEAPATSVASATETASKSIGTDAQPVASRDGCFKSCSRPVLETDGNRNLEGQCITIAGELTALKEAVQTGTFDLRTNPMGQKWSKDKQLAGDYKGCLTTQDKKECRKDRGDPQPHEGVPSGERKVRVFPRIQ